MGFDASRVVDPGMDCGVSADDVLVRYADDVFEAVRSLNHGTYRSVPAPAVYGVLGDLQGAGFGLAQLTEQLARGLWKSLTTHRVYDNERDPQVSVDMAVEALHQAGAYARCMAESLATAQSAINAQGYHPPNTDTDTGADVAGGGVR